MVQDGCVILAAKIPETCSVSGFLRDDGRAALEHLASGRPVFYCLDDYPDDIVKEYPNGDVEIINCDMSGKEKHVKWIKRG